MSLNKVVKLVFVALVLFMVLYFIMGNFLGPGVGDFSTRIINGYEYSDAGGYEKTIIYTGNERPHEIIIDARVDDYKVDGNKLIVARRPRESHLAEDNALTSRLSKDCEYWAINIKTHQVQKVTDSGGLRCN